jgi:predicted branched-subunit amino acid permease
MEAYAYALAQRLAIIWNPQKAMLLKPLADEAYAVAAEQNVEQAQQYISPMIAGYFR